MTAVGVAKPKAHGQAITRVAIEAKAAKENPVSPLGPKVRLRKGNY